MKTGEKFGALEDGKFQRPVMLLRPWRGLLCGRSPGRIAGRRERCSRFLGCGYVMIVFFSVCRFAASRLTRANVTDHHGLRGMRNGCDKSRTVDGRVRSILGGC